MCSYLPLHAKHKLESPLILVLNLYTIISRDDHHPTPHPYADVVPTDVLRPSKPAYPELTMPILILCTE